MRKKYPEYQAPFGVFPAKDGLLAFGYDDNGGTLCWQVSGEANRWPVVCLDGKLSEHFDLFEMTLTEFLVALIKKQIEPKTFPPDFFPIPSPAFVPYTTE